MMHSDSYPFFDVDEHEFDEKIIKGSNNGLILLDIWAEWCSPCLALAPILDRVLSEYEGKVTLTKLDADENMRIAGRYKVRGFPTVIAFLNGEELGRFTSAQPAHRVREFIDEHLPN
ncbi:thioredoxin family protein [Solemya pervernicosa gill symbiont]|nr:thioredoxin domain-containing protein [Solemya pervernicosa gill symbiont]